MRIRKNFTLIEVIVVLVVIMLITGIAVSALRGESPSVALERNVLEVEAYIARVAADVNTTPEQLREYFGEDYIKAEFKKELATNLMIDSAVVKAAE